MGVEESELVIVLGVWESHGQGEARAQDIRESSHHFPHTEEETKCYQT